jgi:hypothetical protein
MRRSPWTEGAQDGVISISIGRAPAPAANLVPPLPPVNTFPLWISCDFVENPNSLPKIRETAVGGNRPTDGKNNEDRTDAIQNQMDFFLPLRYRL